MASSVSAVIANQNDIRGLISRAVTNVKKLELKKRTPEQILTRIEILNANWNKFQANHEILSSLKFDERAALEYFTSEVYTLCEEEYVDQKSELLAYLNELKRKVGNYAGETTTSDFRNAPTSRQLPRIELPKFSGAYREWKQFSDLFSSMISTNREISNAEKLQYLKMCLKGEASQLVINIEVTADNFERAWQTLVNRYENNRVLIDTYLASLFSLARVSQQSAPELKSLLGNVKEALGALKALKCPIESWDCILVYVVTRKIDAGSLIDWEKQISKTNEPAAFADLEQFLLARASEPKKMKNAANAKNQTSAKSRQATATESKPSSLACTLCGAALFLAACQDFRSKTLEQRQNIVKQKNLCFNCLGAHQFRNCRSAKRCRICNNPHHTLIHRTNGTANDSAPVVAAAGQQSQYSGSLRENQASASALPRRDNSQPSSSASTNVALAPSSNYTPVLLATAIVKVTSCYGDQLDVRALLDQGSEVSFISASLAQRINLPRKRVMLPINGIGAQESAVSRGLMNLKIASHIDPTIALSVNAYVLGRLTSYLPPIRILQNPWTHLHDLELADPDFSSVTRIDLILEAEVYSVILEEGLRKGGPGSPIAQRTSLGWILSGSVLSEANSHVSSRPAHGLQCSIDHELLDLVKRFWALEEPTAAKSSKLSEEESQCEQYFADSHTRSSEGRYIVRIPLTQTSVDLGDSYTSALVALKRQEKRFMTNLSLKEAYSRFLADYETPGHMSRVSDSSLVSRRTFYLPHHAVVRENSSTTKVRVVFNGSCRTNLGISVNDLQHVGPKLQLDLTDVITRWRRYATVFVADIEKMYRQILIHEDDRDLQRILWRENQEHPLVMFRLNTVTYGLASAPYLASRTLRQLSIDEGHRFPLAANVIQREIYVDDVLSGADTVAEAQEKIRQVNECLGAGGFPLQKWSANNAELLQDIAPERCDQSRARSIEIDPLVRTLGLQWRPRSDSFVFTTLGITPSSRIIKRHVLSRVAQLFDPLGWIAPVIVRGKIFIQELWSARLGWDDSLPENLANRWRSFEKDLEGISDISVPRWLGLHAASLAIELHGFSDASQLALGAVIYLRVLSDLNDVRVTLVAAKTRVAPLKKVTIPRLELSAAHLLVRQISHVRTILDLEDVSVHLWTDSTVALAYIRGDFRRWAEFVRNRVTEIQELSNSNWHYVPGKDNPADCASRGLSPCQLKEEGIWWNGPAWLSQHSASWPSSVPSINAEIVLETRKTPVTIANKNELPKGWELVERFSSLKTLLRVTAWVYRAVRRFRRAQATGEQSSPLTPEEIDHARLFWVKHTQTTHFNREINELSRGNQISRSSPLTRLTPIIDAAGLLRVGGRLRNSLLDHDKKHPLILPRDSTFSTLIIDEVHQRTLHGKTQVTLATMRRRYWIVGGRVPIRAFIHRCLQCVRYRATLGSQLMGQLPESRATRARPFLNSGVDYAGPLMLRTFRGRGAKSYKGYIVVFVCLSSSAVHLEIATDCTTEGFLAAYKRFTARRGICETLTSDCGTNFLGADMELRTLFQASSAQHTALANLLANDGTRWKFNPPSSPHFGGKWEVAVKSVKFHLKRVIGDTGLTYEEYSTLLSQIEAVLNSRPLCPLSDDPTDLLALTPGHFLIGAALNTIPEPSLIDLPSSRLARWQLIRQLLEQFWRRWSTEYLQHLQTISKWQHKVNSLKIGSLVLVKDERYPPSKWALGRVIKVHPGKDNLVRVVTVRTQPSVYKRPIVKLVLLPISTNEDYKN